MAGSINIRQYVAEDLKRNEGMFVPVQAGMLETLIVHYVSPDRIHPNPDDEFCFPKVGPNDRIITDYERKMREAMSEGTNAWRDCGEPLMVEKLSPDGFRLLNGHHRWAAALKVGLKKVPIKILNTAHEAQIQQMLSKSDKTMRVTFDLDEVVFMAEGSPYVEKKPMFPFNLIYKENIRSGFPGLCSYLNQNGYDIWVFTKEYYSLDYIEAMFNRYNVKVTGILTATEKTLGKNSGLKDTVEKAFDEKYSYTINVYHDEVLFIRGKGEFDQKAFDDTGSGWASKVREIIAGENKNE